MKYFTLYAASKNLNYIEYKTFNRDLKDALNINLAIGYSSVSRETFNGYTISDIYLNTTHLNFGIGFETFLNTTYKKSSFITSLTYHLKSNSDDQNFAFRSGNPDNSTATSELSFLTLDLKYRQYFKLNKNSFVYVNAGAGLSHASGKTAYIFNPTGEFISDLKLDKSNLFLIFGLGYNFNKLSLDINYVPSYSGTFTVIENNSSAGGWNFKKHFVNVSLSYELF